MTLLEEFKWVNLKLDDKNPPEFCCLCMKDVLGWQLQYQPSMEIICMKCCASIATMHNLKEDEIK